jgi:tetratricopeptide (TPR) repeat protein
MRIRSHLCSLTVTLLVVGAGSCLVAPTLHADSIELVSGKRYDKIKAVKATWQLVEFRAGSRKRVPGDQVLRLVRDSERLAQARSLEEAGDVSGALKELANFADLDAKVWEKAEAAYLVGALEHRRGRKKAATKALEAYLEEYKGTKDWFVPAALLALGDLLLTSGKPGTAEVHFKELETMGGAWELRSKLGQGKALLASQGKEGAQDARKLFLEVIQGSKDVELKQEALVARAEALIVGEDPELAIDELNRAFFDSPKPKEFRYGAARARACLLMSRAQVALGGKDRQKARDYLERGELWALRVAVLHRHQVQEFGEACDFLVKLYERLGKKKQAAAWKKRKAAGASS